MNDDPPLLAPEDLRSHSADPRLAALLDELRRAWEQASTEDRAFVLRHLQVTARRFAG